MEVFVERERRTLQRSEGSVAELLASLDINPQTVLVVKNDALVTEDESLDPEDSVRILSVVSGG